MNKFARIAVAAVAATGLSLGGVVASAQVAEARPGNGFVVKKANGLKSSNGYVVKKSNGYRFANGL